MDGGGDGGWLCWKQREDTVQAEEVKEERKVNVVTNFPTTNYTITRRIHDTLPGSHPRRVARTSGAILPVPVAEEENNHTTSSPGCPQHSRRCLCLRTGGHAPHHHHLALLNTNRAPLERPIGGYSEAISCGYIVRRPPPPNSGAALGGAGGGRN